VLFLLRMLDVVLQLSPQLGSGFLRKRNMPEM
jgi:hypothetical protein